MNRLSLMFLAAFLCIIITGCGGGSTNNPVTAPNYTPLPMTGAPSVPTGTLAAKFSNYSVSTVYQTSGSQLNHPVGIATDGTFYYVADRLNHVVRQFNKTGTITNTFGTGVYGYTDGNAAPTFNYPTDVAVTADGKTIYVADAGNHMIRMIDIATKTVTRIAGNSTAYAGSVDDVGDKAYFDQPSGLALAGSSLYVADSGNHTIRRIDLNNSYTVTTVAGYRGSAGSADGTQQNARFYNPVRLAVDATSLYVTDFNNRTVRKINLSDGKVSTIAGNAAASPITSPATGDNNNAIFNQINSVTVVGSYLYLTDSFNNLVYRMGSDGTGVTRIAGDASKAGNIDGIGASTSFSTPFGITTDGNALYINDSVNNSIRKIQGSAR